MFLRENGWKDDVKDAKNKKLWLETWNRCRATVNELMQVKSGRCVFFFFFLDFMAECIPRKAFINRD
jgi:hypothetical protein